MKYLRACTRKKGIKQEYILQFLSFTVFESGCRTRIWVSQWLTIKERLGVQYTVVKTNIDTEKRYW